jgi:hypothetical protein
MLEHGILGQGGMWISAGLSYQSVLLFTDA